MQSSAGLCTACRRPRETKLPFCPWCGAPRVDLIPRSPFDAFSGSPYARLGPPCSTCGSTLSVPSFGTWHVLVAVLGFPFGLAILLAPKRVCSNGHVFGYARIAKYCAITLLVTTGLSLVFGALWFLFVLALVFSGGASSAGIGR